MSKEEQRVILYNSNPALEVRLSREAPDSKWGRVEYYVEGLRVTPWEFETVRALTKGPR